MKSESFRSLHWQLIYVSTTFKPQGQVLCLCKK